MTSLWLVRHGQTDWNLTGRWQGQTPDAPGLNGTGRAQAFAVRDELKDVHFSAIYSSDLLRSRQTSELLAETLGMTVTLEPRLREMNLGAWEGMLAEEIREKYPNELEERAKNPFYTRAPDGESPRQVAERVLAAMEEIAGRHPNGNILIVAHGLSLAVILCHARGIPMDRVYDHIPENAKPIRVEWRR